MKTLLLASSGLAAVILYPVPSFAQAQTTSSFEVASIRPHADLPQANSGKGMGAGGRGTRMSFSGPRAIVSGATLASLLVFAYDLKSYEVPESGWPNWSSEQFDIAAKAEGDAGLT